MTTLSERQEKDDFAKRAANSFKLNPQHWSYTDNTIESGEYFALRFGLGKDCVVVFRIGDEPILNYQQLINNA